MVLEVKYIFLKNESFVITFHKNNRLDVYVYAVDYKKIQKMFHRYIKTVAYLINSYFCIAQKQNILFRVSLQNITTLHQTLLGKYKEACRTGEILSKSVNLLQISSMKQSYDLRFDLVKLQLKKENSRHIMMQQSMVWSYHLITNTVCRQQRNPKQFVA